MPRAPTGRSRTWIWPWGAVDALCAQRIAAELDELPLPWRYDVQPFAAFRHAPLREHIERVGVVVCPP